MHEQSQKFTENEKMKFVYIHSKELKGKLDYRDMLLFFGIVLLIFFIIKYFGFSGIIKWILYLISAFFIMLLIDCLTIYRISYCSSCDEAFDFDVTECPLCGNKLEHISKNYLKEKREEAAQEKKEMVDSTVSTKSSSEPPKTSVHKIKRKKGIDEAIAYWSLKNDAAEKDLTQTDKRKAEINDDGGEKAEKFRDMEEKELYLLGYLFSWDEIPGNDDERIIEYLKDELKIEWAKTENIGKIDNGKTIIVSNKENSLSLKLNDEKTKVNLKIDDGRVDEFTVKKENGKLNLYLLGTGSKADSAFESLFEELQNDDPDIRAEASRLLSKNPKTIEKLVSVYQNCIDSEPRKGVLAGRVLGRNISISAGSQEIIHDETSNIWYGIAVAFTPCVCAHCGSLNLGIPVPEGGLYIGFYYQRDDEEGVYTLPVFCDYCSKEFFLAWDDDPRYLLISYCESCDETFDVDVTECPHCGMCLSLLYKYDIEDIRKKSAQGKEEQADIKIEGQLPKFIRKEHGGTYDSTYEIYEGTDAESAKAFLSTNRIDKKQCYIVVETPEGNWGVDMNGLYLEQLLPWQTNISSAECEGDIFPPYSTFGFEMAARGANDNFIIMVGCGKCGHEWQDGVRYQDITVVRCPKCKTLNKVDSSNFNAYFI